MGAPFENGWADVAGAAMYPGAGTSWEVIWLVISIAICVGAIWSGGRHEADSYKSLD